MNLRNLLASAAVATAALAASTAAMAAVNTDAKQGTGSADIIQPLTVTTNGSDLAFGKIVRPRTGGTAGTVTITNTSGAATRAASGDVVLLGGTSTTAPSFDIAGESGSKYQLVIDPLTLSDAGGDHLAVNLVSTLVGTDGSTTLTGAGTFTHNTLGGAAGTIGSSSTDHLYVGGSIPVSDSSVSGHYSGTFQVTATYE